MKESRPKRQESGGPRTDKLVSSGPPVFKLFLSSV